MPHDKFSTRGLPVPSGRVSRLARFVSMASGVAGGMMLDGVRQFAEGKRPSLQDLLLTPANAIKVTHQLAHLRGAAMKVGQLLSMDAGEIMPRELADILARLRADAHQMPQGQLRATLDRQWGRGWQQRFESFSFRPIAAASIGQVHRARAKDGRELAIKIQYPGVRQSIDSDVDNVAALLRLSGLLPKTLDVAPMLAEAKRQLHEEADYEREGGHLQRFGELLAGSPDYALPELAPDFTGKSILAMSYLEGAALEQLVATPQAERDRIVALLIELLLRELFEFRLMQTDPNFANYRYNSRTRQIVLLDFGAVRAFSPALADSYRALLKAAIDGDRAACRRIAVELGLWMGHTPQRQQDAMMDVFEMAMQPLRQAGPFDFGATDIVQRLRDRGMAIAGDRAACRAIAIDLGLWAGHTPQRQQDAMMDVFEMAMQPLRQAGPFDFGATDIVQRLRDRGMAIAGNRDNWHIPPMDTLFLQRKIGGIFLLASRLKARVHIRPLLEPHLG